MVVRNVTLAVGILMLLAGVVFFLQGINVLPGSYMTGQMFWAWTGLILIIVGSLVAFAGWRARR